MENLADLKGLNANIKDCEKQIKAKDKDLKSLKAEFKKVEESNAQAIAEISHYEKSLLEKEFELREIENEKQIRSQDQKVSQILDELKKRCRGYLGQLFELLKPMNKKYELAIKVAMAKQLKLLVVDTAESSKYVTEFLKEKGLQKDVLILENVPMKSQAKNIISEKQLKQYGGEWLSAVIDVTRRNNGMVQRAVDYFTADKLVCPDFDTVAKLQREAKVKNVVTLDGVEFKQGMISGGQNGQNVFNLNFGSAELDRDIKKLTGEIQRLTDQLDQSKESSKSALDSQQKLRREVDKAQIELNSLEQAKKQSELTVKERVAG